MTPRRYYGTDAPRSTGPHPDPMESAIYSFDDKSFGWTCDGIKIDCKLVSRPAGLTNSAWYQFAADLVHALTPTTHDETKDRVRLIVRTLSSVNLTEDAAERQARRVADALDAAGLIVRR